MMVSEASQWSVVKAALLAEYALPRQEAWRRFTARQLGADEAVDVYLDDLERLGTRVGLGPEDLAFRVKFYEGLPPSEYEWAVMREGAYTAKFATVVTDLRSRLATRRAALGRGDRKATLAAAASGKQQRSDGSEVRCYRCDGPHRVRLCPKKPKQGSSKETSVRSKELPARGSKGTGSVCFRCRKPGHYARACPATAVAVETLCAESDFRLEDAQRGAASSRMEIDTE